MRFPLFSRLFGNVPAEHEDRAGAAALAGVVLSVEAGSVSACCFSACERQGLAHWGTDSCRSHGHYFSLRKTQQSAQPRAGLQLRGTIRAIGLVLIDRVPQAVPQLTLTADTLRPITAAIRRIVRCSRKRSLSITTCPPADWRL